MVSKALQWIINESQLIRKHRFHPLNHQLYQSVSCLSRRYSSVRPLSILHLYLQSVLFWMPCHRAWWYHPTHHRTHLNLPWHQSLRLANTIQGFDIFEVEWGLQVHPKLVIVQALWHKVLQIISQALKSLLHSFVWLLPHRLPLHPLLTLSTNQLLLHQPCKLLLSIASRPL